MRNQKKLCLALNAAACAGSAQGFCPAAWAIAKPMQTRPSSTAVALGIPKFLLPNEDSDESQKEGKAGASSDKNEKKLDMKGLVQLITAGAGAPFLGDFEGVEEETGKFMFSLEANNLVDEDGNSKQTSMPYFENGWVDENDAGFKWPWEKKDE